ncbi:uncharacterized protein, partial [Heterodontus francisci]|uniref:uncharacterized protein n=1 Tax=Heterodontus francisci TaxID=7792 RepID=UPI00355BEBA1
RLSDGGSPCTGRVEIYYNGTWGSVCDDSWDLADADVVCKQLGCGKALDLALPASCGPGSGPVWLDELTCSGNESFLWECPSASWGHHDCSHKEDVRIMCSEHKELRLVNGKHRCEGRVEVFYNGTWGTVCSERLDGPDAEVICKQLQCGPLSSIDYYAQSFGEGSGPIWLDGMECISHESFLWQCQTEGYKTTSILIAVCFGVLLICVFISLMVVIQKKSIRRERFESSDSFGLLSLPRTRLEQALKQDSPKADTIKLSNLTRLAVVYKRTQAADQETVRAQSQHVPLTLKSRTNKSRRPWMSRDLEDWIRNKKEFNGRISELKTVEALEEHRKFTDSIQSLNQIEYYTSHSLGDTDPGSENSEGNSSSIQGLVPADYDDVDIGAIDTQDGHFLLGSGPDDLFTLTSAGGDLSTLAYSSQTRTDTALLVPSSPENNEDVHCDTFTIADIPLTMGSDCVVQHLTSPSHR